MMLWERGAFQIDDPLERFMPNFKDMKVLRSGTKPPENMAPADQKISIRHCLSHTAGFSYDCIEPNSIIDKAYADGGLSVISDGSVSLEDFCDRLSRLPLAYEPGSSWRYSVATDVCARLVEVLSGKAFDKFLRENIILPLGMGDKGFWVPKDKTDRFTAQHAPIYLFDPIKPCLVKQDDPITGEYSTKRAFLYCVRLFGIFESVGKWGDLEWSSTFKTSNLEHDENESIGRWSRSGFPNVVDARNWIWVRFCDKAGDRKGRACSRRGRIPLGRNGWYS